MGSSPTSPRTSSGGGSADEQADAAHEVADKFNDVGTPEDMPEDARNGFEVFIGFLGDVDADDIEAFSKPTPLTTRRSPTRSASTRTTSRT